MANKTNLSSWGSLKNYLTGNIDSTRDWDNIDLKDYSALNDAYSQGIITGDKLAEGKTLFQNYLADAQAADTYAAAQTKAENTARQENAYNNYLHTRLGSYLGELQSNAGQKGYVGTVQGQAVAVKNAQENAYQKTAENKRTSLSDMLATYQQALVDNSAAAIDQQTTLQSSRDAKRDTDLQNYKSEVDTYITGGGLSDGNLNDQGVLTADKATKLADYIAQIPDEAVRSDVQKYIDLTYGDKMQKTESVSTTGTDGSVKTETKIVDANDTKTKQVAQAKTYTNDISYISSSSDLAAKKTEIKKALDSGLISSEDYTSLSATVSAKEKTLYASSKSSGEISVSNTCTLKFGSGSPFTNNNTTVTLGTKKTRVGIPENDVIKNAGYGQAVLYGGTVYVKGDGYLYKVVDYAGNGAYERIKGYLTGTVYDVK